MLEPGFDGQIKKLKEVYTEVSDDLDRWDRSVEVVLVLNGVSRREFLRMVRAMLRPEKVMLSVGYLSPEMQLELGEDGRGDTA